ncbi:Putative dihydrofolate reductase [Toxocara canis]|uniref:dihydrofolate reductase n=1 Tax=Toxocara canis TaxID=6265 RepID=A0A0B2UV70_TOXCA|nr:Putative dihydrofolate reductase [Toxocara canis]
MYRNSECTGALQVGTLHDVCSTEMVPPRIPINIIVAMDSRGGIGKNGDLPWHIPEDLEYFYMTTMKTVDPAKMNAVLMGRKVWESLPTEWRPLKGRLNVVLSRSMKEPKDGSCVVARSFESAIELLNSMGDKIETIWDIGGSRPYDEGLRSDQLRKIYVTFIEGDFNADVFFPSVDFGRYRKEVDFSSEKERCYNGIFYRFETFSVSHQET